MAAPLIMVKACTVPMHSPLQENADDQDGALMLQGPSKTTATTPNQAADVSQGVFKFLEFNTQTA